MSRTAVLVIALVASGTVAPAQVAVAPQRGRSAPPSRIYKFEELRAPQIESLDRERTLFILPSKASAAYGRAVEAWWIAGFADLILRAVRGENMFAHPRFPETVPAPVAAVFEKVSANEAAFEATLEKWLKQRPQRKLDNQ